MTQQKPSLRKPRFQTWTAVIVRGVEIEGQDEHEAARAAAVAIRKLIYADPRFSLESVTVSEAHGPYESFDG